MQSMMEIFPQFDPDFEPESVGLRWEEYKADFENFMIARHGKAFTSISQEVIRASFLHVVGKKVSKLIRAGGGRASYADMIVELDKCYEKAVNTDFERYTFSLARQSKNESFDCFVNRLRVLSANCGFHDVEAEIRSRIIQGCASDQLRMKALAENLDAAKLISTGRAIERAKFQSYQMHQMESVNSVDSNKSSKLRQSNDNQEHKIRKIKCGYCGKEHKAGKLNCPASGKKCHKCKGNNHFSSVCRAKIKEVANVVTSTVANDEVDYCFSINDNSFGLPTVEVSIEENKLLMYIDTCCTINVIDEKTYNELSPRPILRKVANRAWGYQNSPIDFLGEFICKLRFRSCVLETKISVAKGVDKCLLGFKTCDQLGLVKIINSVQEEKNLSYWANRYPTVFSGKLGKLKNFEVKLDIEESVKPTVCKRYPLPFQVSAEVEKIVQQGVADDVFEKASGPTTWLLNPFLVKKSDGRSRFVVDASPTNKAVRRTRYPLPTIKELSADQARRVVLRWR